MRSYPFLRIQHTWKLFFEYLHILYKKQESLLFTQRNIFTRSLPMTNCVMNIRKLLKFYFSSYHVESIGQLFTFHLFCGNWRWKILLNLAALNF